MPHEPHPNFRIVGFVAGTPLLTREGFKRIEELRPGDFIQSGPDGEQPDDGQGDDHAVDERRWWEEN